MSSPKGKLLDFHLPDRASVRHIKPNAAIIHRPRVGVSTFVVPRALIIRRRYCGPLQE